MSGKKTIVTLLRVSLLACPLLFTTPSFAMIDTPSVKVGFSPEGSASAVTGSFKPSGLFPPALQK